MAVAPVVRYMILCEDWALDSEQNQRVVIIGLISNINALGEPSYPLFYAEMCVFLALTEGYGQGEGKIACVYEESGQIEFETSAPSQLRFGIGRFSRTFRNRLKLDSSTPRFSCDK